MFVTKKKYQTRFSREKKYFISLHSETKPRSLSLRVKNGQNMLWLSLSAQ